MLLPELHDAARGLVALATARGKMLTIAESCTSGLVAAAIAGIPGASAVLDRGFITYSYAAKTRMLDVPADMLKKMGAVSADVALAMAHGAITHSLADLAVSITGIAGPDGGTAAKPVGTVWMAISARNLGTTAHHYLFDGNRDAIRISAALKAMQLLQQAIGRE